MTRAITSEFNPTEFFDDEDRFQAYRLAEKLIEPRDEPMGKPRYFLATDADSDTLYLHDTPLWCKIRLSNDEPEAIGYN